MDGERQLHYSTGDIDGLALELGRPVVEVTALLIRYGIIPEPEPSWSATVDREFVEIFVKKYAEGLSCKQISEDARKSGFLFKPSLIAHCLRREGVKLRVGRKKTAEKAEGTEP